jgi:hypothetical protein
MQMHILHFLRDFIKWSRVFVALCVNTAAFLLKGAVAFSEKHQVKFHESCHDRVQILLLIGDKCLHHLVALFVDGLKLIARFIELQNVAGNAFQTFSVKACSLFQLNIFYFVMLHLFKKSSSIIVARGAHSKLLRPFLKLLVETLDLS